MYTRKWHMCISQHAETHTLILFRSMGFCLKLAYLYKTTRYLRVLNALYAVLDLNCVENVNQRNVRFVNSDKR